MVSDLRMAGIIPLGGGMTIGLERAGFDGGETLLEVSEGWTKNLALNRPQYTDFRTTLDEWEQWADEMKEDPPQLIYGSPPCQGVSGASSTSSADNEKNQWFLRATETAVKARPSFIIWENIPRMLTVGRPIWMEADDIARKAGYTMTVHHHDASAYGVCQRRKRLMFVLEKRGQEIAWPTHEALPAPTCIEAIGDLEDMEPAENPFDIEQPTPYPMEAQNEWQAALRSDTGYTWDHDVCIMPDRFELVRPGTAWMHSMPREAMTDKERDRIDGDRLFNAFEMHRLHPDKVARTITGSRNRMHPTRNRLLSVRESSRLMAFPDDWKWAIPGDTQQFAAGVCPPIVEWYGQVITHALAGTAMPVPEGRIV
jgi:site-specific DNA-cytosine methylase